MNRCHHQPLLLAVLLALAGAASSRATTVTWTDDMRPMPSCCAELGPKVNTDPRFRREDELRACCDNGASLTDARATPSSGGGAPLWWGTGTGVDAFISDACGAPAGGVSDAVVVFGDGNAAESPDQPRDITLQPIDASEGATVTFWFRYGSDTDEADCDPPESGETVDVQWKQRGVDGDYSTIATIELSDDNRGWVEHSVELPAAAQTVSEVVVRFHQGLHNFGSEDVWALGLVTVTHTLPTCAELQAAAQTSSELAEVTFDESAAARDAVVSVVGGTIGGECGSFDGSQALMMNGSGERSVTTVTSGGLDLSGGATISFQAARGTSLATSAATETCGGWDQASEEFPIEISVQADASLGLVAATDSSQSVARTWFDITRHMRVQSVGCTCQLISGTWREVTATIPPGLMLPAASVRVSAGSSSLRGQYVVAIDDLRITANSVDGSDDNAGVSVLNTGLAPAIDACDLGAGADGAAASGGTNPPPEGGWGGTAVALDMLVTEAQLPSAFSGYFGAVATDYPENGPLGQNTPRIEFGGAGLRMAVTPPMDLSAGGNIALLEIGFPQGSGSGSDSRTVLGYAREHPDVRDTIDTSDPNTYPVGYVRIDWSSDGSTWHTFAVVDPVLDADCVGPCAPQSASGGTTGVARMQQHSYALPAEAFTPTTQLRLYQGRGDRRLFSGAIRYGSGVKHWWVTKMVVTNEDARSSFVSSPGGVALVVILCLAAVAAAIAGAVLFKRRKAAGGGPSKLATTGSAAVLTENPARHVDLEFAKSAAASAPTDSAGVNKNNEGAADPKA